MTDGKSEIERVWNEGIEIFKRKKELDKRLFERREEIEKKVKEELEIPSLEKQFNEVRRKLHERLNEFHREYIKRLHEDEEVQELLEEVMKIEYDVLFVVNDINIALKKSMLMRVNEYLERGYVVKSVYVKKLNPRTGRDEIIRYNLGEYIKYKDEEYRIGNIVVNDRHDRITLLLEKPRQEGVITTTERELVKNWMYVKVIEIELWSDLAVQKRGWSFVKIDGNEIKVESYYCPICHEIGYMIDDRLELNCPHKERVKVKDEIERVIMSMIPAGYYDLKEGKKPEDFVKERKERIKVLD